jgi:dihydrofolate reductase
MPRVRIHNVSISLDGYMAGPDQSLDHPLGVGGEQLHDWLVATQSWRGIHGRNGGEAGVDSDFAGRSDVGIGAVVMGRNMYGPVRGPWDAEMWKGWWGDEPPFHNPVFVLTHHPHEPITMEGGTTFTFVDRGIETALDQALAAAGGQDVQISGGAGTIRQFLRAGLVDEAHFAIVPLLLGGGERPLDDLGDAHDLYEVVEVVPSGRATHVRIARRAERT